MTALPYSPIRSRLGDLVKRHGEDMAGLSRVIGRPAGYLGAYLRRGTPKALPDQERELLAAYFRVHPLDLLSRTLKEGRRSRMEGREFQPRAQAS